MADRREVPLRGPSFQRALTLAREAVREGVLGTPVADAAIEPVLTEAANDRMVGASLNFLLIAIGSQATVAAVVAKLESEGVTEPDPSLVAERASSLVDDICDALATAGGIG